VNNTVPKESDVGPETTGVLMWIIQKRENDERDDLFTITN
jgi:hypothetical protein